MNNNSDTGTRVPTYKCAFCQGKIVTCNCEKGFKNAVETSLLDNIVEKLTTQMYAAAKKESWDEMAAYQHAIIIARGSYLAGDEKINDL